MRMSNLSRLFTVIISGIYKTFKITTLEIDIVLMISEF
jgi:hypothetical protein